MRMSTRNLVQKIFKKIQQSGNQHDKTYPSDIQEGQTIKQDRQLKEQNTNQKSKKSDKNLSDRPMNIRLQLKLNFNNIENV